MRGWGCPNCGDVNQLWVQSGQAGRGGQYAAVMDPDFRLIAFLGQHEKIVELLIMRGADASITNREGESAVPLIESW